MSSVDPFVERAYRRRLKHDDRLHPTTPKHRRSPAEWLAHNGPCLILCVPLHILLEHLPWI